MPGQILMSETTTVRYGSPGVRAQLLGCWQLFVVLECSYVAFSPGRAFPVIKATIMPPVRFTSFEVSTGMLKLTKIPRLSPTAVVRCSCTAPIASATTLHRRNKRSIFCDI